MTTKVECPECRKKTLALGDGDPTCKCGYSATADEAAERYTEVVLGISKYARVKDGGELPIYECPSCEMGDSLVDCGSSNAPRFLCFCGGETWPDRALVQCDGAGSRNPHWARPFSAAVCDGCIQDVISRDNS